MNNNITGGTYPTITASNIWKKIYKNSLPKTLNNDKALKLNIDKISYEQNGDVLLAEEIAPKKFIIEELFTNNHRPTKISSIFSSPKIDEAKLSVNKKGISIQLCQTNYCNYKIYRVSKGKKEEIYDSINNNDNNIFIDNNVKPNIVYEYYVLPYNIFNNTTYFGKELYVGKIKSPINNIDDWWIDDFD